MPGRILAVDDDPDTCELLSARLSAQGYEVETRTSASEALEVLAAKYVDAVITDIHMPGMSGIELCQRVVDCHPDTLVIIVTGQSNIELAIAALRAGAHDFVMKPLDISQLLHRLAKAIRHTELVKEVRRLYRVLDRDRPSTMIGGSAAIKRVQALVERVAESDVPVLITGESGVGKELVARELHRHGIHADGPFIAVNCAAMPSQLLESELFGHVRGAFTDAKRSRDGLLVRATNGTIFLDEIGELPLDMQPKLLRALQERKVRPVGSEEVVAFNARIITATNRDLETEIEEGRFREDLFYRINVINIHVPPLRSRRTDILLLAQYFVSSIAERTGKPVKRIGTAAAEKLLAYDWPGNVRELENCLEGAAALARLDEIGAADLPDKLTRYDDGGELGVVSDDPEDLPTLEQLENRYILRVLRAVKGNKSQAAQILGLARRTLYRRLERSGEEDELEAGDDRPRPE